MSIEQEAEKLARWMDKNPGRPLPDGLDATVVKAAYALRPDLTPKKTGAFSGPVEDEAITEEAPIRLAEIIEFSSLRTDEVNRTVKRPSRPTAPTEEDLREREPISPRFILGVVGGVALLAVSAALLILIPALQGQLLSVKTPSDSESTLSVSEAALLAQANTLYAAKKPMEAAATLEGALHRVRTPTAQGFAATASTFYLQANDPQKAVAVASRCVNLSAKNTSKLSACYQALAKAYDATGETEKSQSARDKAARLDKKRIGL